MAVNDALETLEVLLCMAFDEIFIPSGEAEVAGFRARTPSPGKYFPEGHWQVHT